jgi:hypothetical protein
MELPTHDELVRPTPTERLAFISQLWHSLEDDHLPTDGGAAAELHGHLVTLDLDRSEDIHWTTPKGGA